MENNAFLGPLGQKPIALLFHFGKIRAEKKSLVLFNNRFLREYSVDFDNSFFPSSAHARSTGYTSMSKRIVAIGGARDDYMSLSISLEHPVVAIWRSLIQLERALNINPCLYQLFN